MQTNHMPPLDQQPRLVFMGSCSFALRILEHLSRAYGEGLVGIVTAPARPKGRGHRITATTVAEWGSARNIPVITPTSWSCDEARQWLRMLNPTVAVVASYGFILPAKVLSIPTMGCVNVHPSLLPRWRGASPIVSTILHRDTQTGVSIMVMDQGMDTGPVLAQERISIDPEKTTSAQLGEQLADMGGVLLIRTLGSYMTHSLFPQPQDTQGVTIASKIHKAMGKLDWSQPAHHLVCQINALQPWPGTWGEIKGHNVTLLSAIAGSNISCDVESVPLGTFLTSKDPRLPPLEQLIATQKPYGGVRCGEETWLYPVMLRSLSGKTLGICEWMMGDGQRLMDTV